VFYGLTSHDLRKASSALKRGRKRWQGNRDLFAMSLADHCLFNARSRAEDQRLIQFTTSSELDPQWKQTNDDRPPPRAFVVANIFYVVPHFSRSYILFCVQVRRFLFGWRVRAPRSLQSEIIFRLRDEANVKQRWSNRIRNTHARSVLQVCFVFASSCKQGITGMNWPMLAHWSAQFSSVIPRLHARANIELARPANV